MWAPSPLALMTRSCDEKARKDEVQDGKANFWLAWTQPRGYGVYEVEDDASEDHMGAQQKRRTPGDMELGESLLETKEEIEPFRRW